MASCNQAYQNFNENSCRNVPFSLENKSLAMAYVPWQKWGNLYQPDEGFHRGTIFQDLDLPFTGRRVC